MNREQAETVALKALGWLMEEPDRMESFMSWSGAGSESLADGARDPVFLGFVLDYLMQSDDQVVDFCDHEGLPYDIPARARAALPGGEAPHWT